MGEPNSRSKRLWWLRILALIVLAVGYRYYAPHAWVNIAILFSMYLAVGIYLLSFRPNKRLQVEEYIDKLKQFIPEFPDYWESEDAAFNFEGASTVHGVFSDFSTLVIEKLEAETLTNAEPLFSFIESVVASGGDPANAACTCFLENILNRIPGSINTDTFVPYLGSKSVDFCRGWDEFTGVKTRGL